jgi:hypothetical protein
VQVVAQLFDFEAKDEAYIFVCEFSIRSRMVNIKKLRKFIFSENSLVFSPMLPIFALSIQTMAESIASEVENSGPGTRRI